MTRSVSWPRVGVQTARHLQHKHRRLDRRTLSAEVVVNRMYEGACLHLYHDRRRGPVWRLSVHGCRSARRSRTAGYPTRGHRAGG